MNPFIIGVSVCVGLWVTAFALFWLLVGRDIKQGNKSTPEAQNTSENEPLIAQAIEDSNLES